jgi:bifunctional non-homologous end joining protein LigD
VKTNRKSRSSASSLKSPSKRSPRRMVAKQDVAGVKITHPERVVYPDANVTKLMVAEYYARVADRLLP